MMPKKGELINLAERKEGAYQNKAAKWFEERIAGELLGKGPKSDQHFKGGLKVAELVSIFKGYFMRTSAAENFNQRLLRAFDLLKDNLWMHRYHIAPDNIMNYTRIIWMQKKMKEAAKPLARE